MQERLRPLDFSFLRWTHRKYNRHGRTASGTCFKDATRNRLSISNHLFRWTSVVLCSGNTFRGRSRYPRAATLVHQVVHRPSCRLDRLFDTIFWIQQSFFLINRPPQPYPQNAKNAFSHQNHHNTYITIGRTNGAKDLPEAKRGALIELHNTSHISKNQLAKKYACHKKTVTNVLKRAENAEKENLDLLSLEAHQRRL